MLSRPTPPSEEECARERETEEFIRGVMEAESGGVDDTMLQSYKEATAVDEDAVAAMRYLKEGWPKSVRDCPKVLRELFSLRHELSVSEGLLRFRGRVYVPRAMRSGVLLRVHRGHQGVERCLRKARDTVWWPGMTADIKADCARCETCIKARRITSMPMQPSRLPEGPWEKVGADVMTFQGQRFLVMVDYFSRWVEVVSLRGETTREICDKMDSIFARFGAPMALRTDNGPCFAAQSFSDYCSNLHIAHTTSSPLYPESNGLVERAVQTMKGMVTKSGNFYTSLWEYRATPLQSGHAPAELMLGRNIRSGLPRREEPKSLTQFRKRDGRLKECQRLDFDRRKRAMDLADLRVGQRVWVKEDNGRDGREGRILGKAAQPRSYWVEVGGTRLRRTRIHLRPLPDGGADTEGREGGSSRQSGGTQSDLEGDECVTDSESDVGEGGGGEEFGVRRSARVGRPNQRPDYVYY
jgi:transposase InsO family protein